MTPVHCRVKTDPQAGTRGDCLRACIASLFDLDPMQVPHFFADTDDGPTGMALCRDWLSRRKLDLCYIQCDPSTSLQELLENMGVNNSTTPYLLFSEGHVVVCRGGRIEHDPAWFRVGLTRPANGFYIALIVAAL